MTRFDICEMCRLVLISFEQKIEQKKLDVEFICDEDSMFVSADKDAIYQVVYNLCDNAIKFSFESGQLRLSLKRAAQSKIRVSLFNSGKGISKADLPYIFDRFYKSDKSRGLDKSGVGLGLYIVKAIIEAHGERISAESTEGQFCEFAFLLKESAEKEGCEKEKPDLT